MNGVDRLTAGGLTIVALILGQLVKPSSMQAQADPDPVLDAAVAKFQRITTLRADFTQSVHDEMIGSDALSRGEFLEQRPNRLAMRFSQPAGDLIIADGSYFWLYLPSTTPGQVVKTAISSNPGDSPDIVAQFLERPRDRFTITMVKSEPVGGRPADVLAFVPREGDGPYKRVQLWIDRGDSLPHQIEILEASGATRRFNLDRIRINVAIPPSTFLFRPPANVRVVDASSNE
jgi:outer membrane lipoprotein carrier protein